ncbi:MAG: hypothetical protein ACLQM8_09140 [Limisphaerales bacterium]
MKNRFLFLPVLLLSLPLASAQAPSGSVSFTFDRTTFPVWDFTGAYQFNQQIVGAEAVAPLSFPVFINQDLVGRLHGAGTTIVTLGTYVVSANYVLNGAVSGGGNATRATFTVSLVGDGLDAIAGERRSYSVSLTYNLIVDPDPANPPAWIPPGHGAAVRGSVRISGIGSASVVPGDGFAVSLPPGADGAWGVAMNIFPLNRLVGTATIVIAGSASPEAPAYQQPGTLTLDADLEGAYKPGLGFSQVRLTGMRGSSPAALQLTFVNGQTPPTQVAGKLLGQTVSLSY